MPLCFSHKHRPKKSEHIFADNEGDNEGVHAFL
jgi:hypothetical protein